MVRYLNPGGFNFGSKNFDGYGISLIVFGVAYSLFFYTACAVLWLHRNHPIIRMRNSFFFILSLLVLHVFCFMVMVAYTLNGATPCGVEFWSMNIYLPLGIGLFQLQNQQLLIVSRRQASLMVTEGHYKPVMPKGARGLGGPKYWYLRLRIWRINIGTPGRCQWFVAIGIIVQARLTFHKYYDRFLDDLSFSSRFPSSSITPPANSVIMVWLRNTQVQKCVVEDGNGMLILLRTIVIAFDKSTGLPR